EPDLYDAILHGFLAMEADDLPAFCRSVREAEAKQERMVVCAGGRRYSVQRFCPHQGADLEQGWIEEGRFLVCPRHRWRFDLEQGGACRASSASLCAHELDSHPREVPVEAKVKADVGMDLELEAESGAPA
ncbi:MAG TPA: Rieske 2Fe-2S domain-containing protein, partial [Myxococcales bacterium]|nr:Rieske 2Fe-2S domain-containing protein [Myxococcales bacterium]